VIAALEIARANPSASTASAIPATVASEDQHAIT
jgi:hypothetical protein